MSTSQSSSSLSSSALLSARFSAVLSRKSTGPVSSLVPSLSGRRSSAAGVPSGETSGARQNADWRRFTVIFWINLPIGAAAFAVIWYFVPARKVDGHWKQ